MNTAGENDCIDDMITKLTIGQQSMKSQTKTIADIVEKSNNILMHIEQTQAKYPQSNLADGTTFVYKKDTLHTFAKILEQYNMLVRNYGAPSSKSDFEKYLNHHRQLAEFFGSNVRKLLALNDMVSQMIVSLKQQHDENDNTDTD